MKKTFTLVFILCLAVSFAAAAHADWVDNWLNNATANVQGPSAIKSATRNYYSGGLTSLRWTTGTTYPVNFSLPHASFGCGGIDVFLGSMGLLDFDYLVSRMKNVMYSAGAFAFQYALSRLNPKANQIIEALSATQDALSHLQLDECRAGKAIGMKLVSDFSPESAKDMGTLKQELEAALGIDDSWEEAKKKWQQTLAAGSTSKHVTSTEMNRIASGCTGEIRNLADNTFLEYLSGKAIVPANFVPILRGLAGDIKFAQGGTVVPIAPCKQVQEDLGKALLNGTLLTCTGVNNNACVCPNFTSGLRLEAYVKDHLGEFYQNMLDREKPGGSTVAFVKAIYHYPVYSLLRMARQSSLTSSDILTTDSALVKCTSYYYAVGLLANITTEGIRSIDTILTNVAAACSSTQDVGKCVYCKSDTREQIRKAVREYTENLRDLRTQIASNSLNLEACVGLQKVALAITGLNRLEQGVNLPAKR